MNRRSLLKSAPAVAMAACVPLPAAAGESEVTGLYREFIAHRDYGNTADLSDDELDRHNELAEDLLKRIVETPSQRPEDTAIKFLAVTADYDALFGNPYQGTLEAEARALTGIA